jgi:hypothetical protein
MKPCAPAKRPVPRIIVPWKFTLKVVRTGRCSGSAELDVEDVAVRRGEGRWFRAFEGASVKVDAVAVGAREGAEVSAVAGDLIYHREHERHQLHHYRRPEAGFVLDLEWYEVIGVRRRWSREDSHEGEQRKQMRKNLGRRWPPLER